MSASSSILPSTAASIHPLASGRLEIHVTRSDYELSALCDFAARRNPKRGFLFVSKVLGRYLPVRPSQLGAAWRALTRQIPSDIEGPIVVIGVAEAGIALADGVHRELVAAGRTDTLLLHTTRYRFERPLAFDFDEPHSHAPAHRVYEPDRLTDRALLDHARTVLVVDDEITTGRTFRRLVHRFLERYPRARHFHHLVLTDWHEGCVSETVEAPDGVRVSSSALLAGHYRFHPDPCFRPRMPDVRGDGRCKLDLVGGNHGRFGLRRPFTLPDTCVPDIAPGHRVLVLGSGEFQGPPLQLAETLESRGVDVWFQATTRAPVMAGGAIRQVLTFEDNYDEGIPNYLYNVDPDDYDQVYVCVETPAATLPTDLMSALDAVPLFF